MADRAALERLANGVLLPGFLGTSVPDWLRDELRGGLAGVLYFSHNLTGDTAALSAELRQENPDLVIAIDEEGGSVTRLEADGGSTLPGPAQLGLLDDVTVTDAVGAELARRVRAAGCNLVVAPVADVNTDPRNPVIGARAFGSDSALVSRHVAAAVAGVQRGGAIACAKHFPGHGDTHTDSHLSLPVVDLGADEMERTHLPPFRAAIDAGVGAIMTAHIVVPAWGEQPATLNPAVLGMLRAWGYDGVVVTDALDMAAIRETEGIGGGAVKALAAGADLLCIGNPITWAAESEEADLRDFREARDAIVDALRDGRLSEERVRESAERVVRMVRAAPTEAPAVEPLDSAEIVRRAVRVHGELPALSAVADVLDIRDAGSIAVDGDAEYVATTLADGGSVIRAGSPDDVDAFVSEGSTAIVLADRLHEGSRQRDLIAQAAAADRPVVVVNVGVPLSEELEVPLIEVAAASAVGAQVAREVLRGRS